MAVLVLPPAADGAVSQVFNLLSAPLTLHVEPGGRWFEAYAHRLHAKQSLSQHSPQSSSSESTEEEEEEEEEEEDNPAFLLGLDPKEWKKQDHYAVLGLRNLRYRATENQIKKAYKKKVLLHHPDKRKARGLRVKEGEDDYFTCITRAYEVLGNPAKRRAFDSVDPEFDNIVPPVNASSKKSFYSVFRPVFEANARWSTNKRVPTLGDENTDFRTVEKFYSFWFNFESWREFSYLDEEEKEKGENREERRWIEKQNKAARQKRKKEEASRVRQLVDNAYSCDPRVLNYMNQKKEQKLAEKKAKQEAARQREEEEERRKQQILEEERLKREKEEEETKAAAAAARKEKEAQKKVFKKERKTMRTLVKDFDYFASDETERVTNMQEVDRLAEVLSLVNLQSLNEVLGTQDKEQAKIAFLGKVGEVKEQLEEEKRRQMELLQRQGGGEGKQGAKVWSEEELACLIKAVNLFPAGTKDRWEVIASFIGQHVPDSNKNAKDVLAKAKELQKNDGSLKEEAKKKAFEKFEKDHKTVASQACPSERLESVVEQQLRETGTNPAPWTAEEQKLLEQALKTYPTSHPERWEAIAAELPSRSKKDCMKRYKELCAMVQSKKAAQAAAAKGKK